MFEWNSEGSKPSTRWEKCILGRRRANAKAESAERLYCYSRVGRSSMVADKVKKERGRQVE